MMVSLYLYDIFYNYHTAQYASGVDPSRIASMVMAGIGFVGAGTIIHTKGSIWGLTTAACLWIAAALGLAIGCGYYLAAIITTIISLGSLIILKQVERLIKKDWYHHINIEMEDRANALQEIKQILQTNGATILKIIFNKNVITGEIIFGVSIKLHQTMDKHLIDTLAQISGVRKIRSD